MLLPPPFWFVDRRWRLPQQCSTSRDNNDVVNCYQRGRRRGDWIAIVSISSTVRRSWSHSLHQSCGLVTRPYNSESKQMWSDYRDTFERIGWHSLSCDYPYRQAVGGCHCRLRIFDGNRWLQPIQPVVESRFEWIKKRKRKQCCRKEMVFSQLFNGRDILWCTTSNNIASFRTLCSADVVTLLILFLF